MQSSTAELSLFIPLFSGDDNKLSLFTTSACVSWDTVFGSALESNCFIEFVTDFSPVEVVAGADTDALSVFSVSETFVLEVLEAEFVMEFEEEISTVCEFFTACLKNSSAFSIVVAAAWALDEDRYVDDVAP